MKNKIWSYLLEGFFAILLGFGFFGSLTYAQEQVTGECKGIKLNTNFPVIGNCINTSNGTGTNVTTAFPVMMNALAKIVVAIVLVVCFILVIVAGIMWAGNNPGSWKGGGAKGLLRKVAITILLLGLTGVILKAINPVFFS